jgi:hypothetical protein
MGGLFSTGPSAETKRFMGATDSSLASMRGTRDAFDAAGNRAAGRAGVYRPKADEELENYASTLRRGTTDTDRAALVNRNTGNVGRAYESGQAALTAQMQARGLSPDSSAALGTAAALEGGRAGAMASAASNADAFFDQDQQRRQRELQLLYGGQADQADQQFAAYNDRSANLSGNLASGYGNLYAQSAAEDARSQQQMMDLIGAAAGMAGPLLGSGMPGIQPDGGQIMDVPWTEQVMNQGRSALHDQSYGMAMDAIAGSPEFAGMSDEDLMRMIFPNGVPQQTPYQF